MKPRKRAMDNHDFLTDFRLILLLNHTDPLLKGRVAQHPKLHHFPTGDFHRTVHIPVFQNVKRHGTLCQQRDELLYGHFKLDENKIMNNRNQDPTGFRIVCNLLFHISHGDKTSETFPFQKVTHD